MALIPAGFEWTTPFIADACVQLGLPVRIGPSGLRANTPGARAAGPARPARHAWSLGTCPNCPLKLRPRAGDALVCARFGVLRIGLDDIVFADDDGVVVTAASHVERIVAAAQDIAAREGAQAARLLKGDLLRSQLDLKGYIEKRNADASVTFRDHLKSFGGAIEI